MADASGITNNRNDNNNTKSTETDKLSDLLTSNRLTERGKTTYLMSATKETGLIGSNIKLDFRTPCRATEVVCEVFNIQELLELILCQLTPGHTLKSKRVCKGFKESIEASKSMREKTSSFINIDAAQEYGYFFNLGPQLPIVDHTKPIAQTGPNLFYLTFTFTKSLSFTKLAQATGFRQLSFLNKSLQAVKVSYMTQNELHQYILVLPPTNGGAITMGQIFDAITGTIVSQNPVDALDLKVIVF